MSAVFPPMASAQRLSAVPRDAMLDEEEARKRAAEWGDEVETAIRQDPVHGRAEDEELSLDESTQSVKEIHRAFVEAEVSTALRNRPPAVSAAMNGWPTIRVMIFAFIVGFMGLVIGLVIGIGGTYAWFSFHTPEPIAAEQ